METSFFLALTLACAPQVHADTTRALVSVESAFNPWAIGVVGGALVLGLASAAAERGDVGLGADGGREIFAFGG